ncbi:FAS1-like dehydratase domain-containing protein [Pseudomonas sp. NPDC089569]|uniref:FAS1-like dehydratase domain-containing protein n=1 Tax=Pseudomonas sp. NPDC089569 TaxID=3390722 RepID=UPI003D085D82
MDDFTRAAWLGRTEEVYDLLDQSHVSRVAATLGTPAPEQGAALPALWHWAFFQSATEEWCLGPDGHPVVGAFLAPPAGRSRMWAGGRVTFLEPLRIGIEATRASSVLKVEEKTGTSGSLLFVTVRHEYRQQGRVAIREEQDIVYREPSPAKLTSAQPLTSGHWRAAVEPTAVLLFRYSAVTCNAHRIHYDLPYATQVEGYPGLVVQGPLIATLTVGAFCRANPTAHLRHFAFRGMRPLIAPHCFEVGGRISEPGVAQTWAGDESGLAQSSEIHFD